MLSRISLIARRMAYDAVNEQIKSIYSMKYIEERVIDTIRRSDKVAIEKIDSNSHFRKLGLDSLDMVEIVCMLEGSFGIEIKNEDAEKINSVPLATTMFHQYIHQSQNKA